MGQYLSTHGVKTLLKRLNDTFCHPSALVFKANDYAIYITMIRYYTLKRYVTQLNLKIAQSNLKVEEQMK